MASGWSVAQRAAAAAAALILPLWLGACAPGAGIPSGAAASEQAAPAEPLTPVPQPQAPPPAGSLGADFPTAGPDSGGVPPASAPAEGSAASPVPSPPAGTSGSGSAGRAPTALPGTSPASDPPVRTREPEDPPLGVPAGTQSVTAYYVLLDDGGSSGVRFGCNDSLVGVRHANAESADPLSVAISALLDGSAPPIADVYNSLSGSTLGFLAGSFDGTTVTVYLAGTIRPGGVCDIPRIEAQLTQTAVSAVGAIRAEIYVNGEGLAEALSLK